MKKKRYEILEDELHLLDEELGLDIRAPFSPRLLPDPVREGEGVVVDEEEQWAYCVADGVRDGQARLYYANGKIQGESYYSKGRLHGPSRFYSESGDLVSTTWFVEGKRQGVVKTPTSIERFVDGELHGTERFFTPNKKKRSVLEYKNGKLHGLTRLYYPNGQLKREVGFKEGKRSGLERMWDANGTLILEATFHQDQLVERSRRWFSNGELAEEIVYYTPPQKHDKRQWDSTGKLLLEGRWEGDRYLEKQWDFSGELLSERKGNWEGKLVFE